MGQYLLKGYKMLAFTCAVCDVGTSSVRHVITKSLITTCTLTLFLLNGNIIMPSMQIYLFLTNVRCQGRGECEERQLTGVTHSVAIHTPLDLVNGFTLFPHSQLITFTKPCNNDPLLPLNSHHYINMISNSNYLILHSNPPKLVTSLNDICRINFID